MCGIAGLVFRRADPAIGRTLRSMGDLLAHRGPDGQGFAVADAGRFVTSAAGVDLPPARIGLAHRRLSIIDLSDAAWQPMCDQNGRRAISYNGEIYNHLELRRSVLGGEVLKSVGDTEVLLRLVAARWTDALDQLVGMFAFGFVDLERNRLLLVRDPFGIKPLHFLTEPHRFAFASEIRPLLALMERRPRVDPLALQRFLRHGQTDSDERTFVAEIRQVPPGHALELDLDEPARFHIFPWWRPPAVAPRSMTPRAAAEELRAIFLDSVQLHLRADIPVATTLSGGIDSSGIVAAVRFIAGGPAVVHAFTYRADDPALDESRYATLAAEAAQVVRHDVEITAEEFADNIDAVIAAQEQPFTTMSIFSQTAVFRAVAKAGFKVALDGQGSDELFAGYHVFRTARLAGLLRNGCLLEAVGLLRGGAAATRMLTGAVLRLLPGSAADAVRQLLGRAAVPDWADRGWFERHAGPAMDKTLARATLREELADSFLRTSLPMLLRYADRNAMASSVENRVPFLIPGLVRFAAGLPDALLIDQWGTTKRVLRDALRGLVPDPILDRTDKIGFQAPESRWLATSARLRDRLRAILPQRLPPCLAPAFRSMTVRMLDGGGYDPAVWRGLCFVRWCEQHGVDVPA